MNGLIRKYLPGGLARIDESRIDGSADGSSDTSAHQSKRRRLLVLPTLSLVALLALTLLAADRQRVLEHTALAQANRSYRLQLARRLERILEHQVRSLQVLALSLQRFDSDRDRQIACQSTLKVTSSTRALQWFAADGSCQLAFHDGAEITPLVAAQLPRDWKTLWESARRWTEAASPGQTPEAFISAGFVEPDVHGRLQTFVEVLVPLRTDPARGPTAAANRSVFGGVIAGKFSLGRLVQPITNDNESDRYEIALRDAAGSLFATRGAAGIGPGTESESVRVHNVVWKVQTLPGAAARAAAQGHTPGIILGAGGLVTLLVAAGFVQARSFRRRQLRQARSYAAALETLQAVSASIGTKLGSGDDVLARLAAASAELIGVDRVRVSLLVVAPDGTPTLQCLASYGWPAGVDVSFPLAELPNTQTALKTSRAVVIDDVSTAVVSHRAREFDIQSVMLVPIVVDNRPIGTMSLCCGRKHFFTPDRQRLARLWGVQAAVVLTNTHLHRKAQRALLEQRGMLQQRERLSDITAKIYAEQTLAGTLQQITNLSTRMLGVHDCAVLLRPPGGGDDDLVLTAFSPDFARFGMPTRITSTTGRVRQVYESRRVDIMVNASQDPHLDPRFRQLLGNVSVMSFPIYQSDQQPLGLLCWLRTFPGPFSAEQIELAEIFASRAAVALENAGLHEQTLQDGQTKAMLLRELNHRVKNNLAGIVGLMRATEMSISEENRPAVARLAQRVRTIAQAHELFVDGATNISVRQMIERVLSPVAAVSGGVGIKVFCHNVRAKLRTDRAVSMAMVLHELAFNAASHGCDPDGHIEVHARTLQNDLIIEVIDSGASGAPPLRLERSGMGLQLVQGLVRRELHGRFELKDDPRGGSRAVVQVPLDETELASASPEEVHA